MDRLIMFTRLTAAIIFLLSSALHAEERIEAAWTIRITGNAITASVNGTVIRGDRLLIRILPGRCNIANTITTFSTYKNNSAVTDLKNVLASAKFGDANIDVNIPFAIEFMSGHRLFVDLGWNSVEDIKRFFAGQTEVTLALEDNENFRSSEFLDVMQNSWPLTGLNGALDDAQEACEIIMMKTWEAARAFFPAGEKDLDVARELGWIWRRQAS